MYDGNFKAHVVKYMQKNHLTMLETARHFKISQHSKVKR